MNRLKERNENVGEIIISDSKLNYNNEDRAIMDVNTSFGSKENENTHPYLPPPNENHKTHRLSHHSQTLMILHVPSSYLTAPPDS